MVHIHCIEIRGSHLLQFPWDSAGFVGFKEVSYGVVQNLVWDAKSPRFIQSIKIHF
jgi:hypothetical protein